MNLVHIDTIIINVDHIISIKDSEAAKYKCVILMSNDYTFFFKNFSKEDILTVIRKHYNA